MSQVREHGLLYLPKPYVVPGGRFNEMYGWDSFFIQLGLLRDGQVKLARDIADNFLYEIREYGMVLNANRTYYLTRSQPPFLTQMVLAAFEKTQDLKWLEDSVPALESYYKYWISEPHLTPETGLSRYIDLGHGPAPEVISSEHDNRGRTDYELLLEYFRNHKIPDYDVTKYYDLRDHKFTDAFYKGDRSMRESGFDPSSRFGPFNIDIVHYNPVCLNSLLYLMEAQMGQILHLLNKESETTLWEQRAAERVERINRLLWDEKDGLYYDYNFLSRKVRRYSFLTTFYPLWAGFATDRQAASVVANLGRFQRAGGLQTSEFQSGDQWDSPFGWAPLQLIAVEGLRRYSYKDEADRISINFLKMVHHEYRSSGNLEEKYDVVRGSAQIGNELRYGYRTNEAGFGWTNGVFEVLFDGLSKQHQSEILTGK